MVDGECGDGPALELGVVELPVGLPGSFQKWLSFSGGSSDRFRAYVRVSPLLKEQRGLWVGRVESLKGESAVELLQPLVLVVVSLFSVS